ncbi:hypothetical protein, partial [Pseudomonas aeruginosa]|uniref:hypothetical protein n=1 Tax=Pseudomonas aeruginosa TaxID=287 RepID=UPI00117B736F
KLTAAVVTDALIGQLPKLQSELASFGDSVSKEWTAIEDTIRRCGGQANQGAGQRGQVALDRRVGKYLLQFLQRLDKRAGVRLA